MTAVARLRVLCVDDHPVVRLGLRALIAPEPDLEVVGEAAGEADAVDAACRLRPDLVVMDLRLRDGDGLDATRSIVAALPRTRVLVLTSYAGDEGIHRAIDAGARGYVLKEFAHVELLDALRAVAAGRRYVSPDVAARLVAHGPRVALTVREREVLGGVAEGLRNKEIADRLGITEATARTHVQNILAKFGCRDRGRVVAAALARGFLIDARLDG